VTTPDTSSTSVTAMPSPRSPDGSSLSEVAITATLVAGLLDASPDGMLLIDGDGTLLLVNARVEQMFGYSRSALLGQPVEMLLPESLRDDHHRHRERYAAEPRLRPMGVGLELRGRRLDGTEFPVEISLSPLSTHDGQLTVAAIRDATQQHAAEHDRQARALADEQSRIAASLADTVIGGLFGTGLRLQGLVDRVPEPVRAQLLDAIDGIDITIRDIRSTIFDLGAHHPAAADVAADD
jgi:PAS domain S-box-containing protein